MVPQVLVPTHRRRNDAVQAAELGERRDYDMPPHPRDGRFKVDLEHVDFMEQHR
jgi:hypothetical protein